MRQPGCVRGSRSGLHRRARLAAGLAVLLWAAAAEATPVGIDWTETSPANTVGTLNGVAVSVTGILRGRSAGRIVPSNFDGLPFAAAPLTLVDSILYGGGDSNWTATFDQPIPGLRIYASFWRGSISSVNEDVFDYTFSRPFTILSGLEDAVILGNTLSLADRPTAFHNGIIEFPGLTSTLSLTVTAPVSPFSSDQRFTFGVDTTAVPEPPGIVLALLALAALRHRGRCG